MRSSRRTIVKTLFAGLAAAIATPAAISPVSAQTAGKPMTTPSGLQIIDSNVGTGASPKPGQICVMHYTGWLYENGQKGKKFDSSVDRNEPFEFPIGQKRVIAGWDEGVATMKVGGKRTQLISATFLATNTKSSSRISLIRFWPPASVVNPDVTGKPGASAMLPTTSSFLR